MFKKDSWQGMFKLSRTSNYAIWDRDDNKFKTIKHVARWRDIWNNTTKLLLFGRKLHQENPNLEINSDIVELDLPKRIKNLKNIIKHFWKRWCFEYVTSLRECQKSLKTEKSVISCKKNDLVLLYEEKQPVQKWLLPIQQLHVES